MSTIPDDARRYVTSDEDGHLRTWVTRWLAVPPVVVEFASSTVWFTPHTFDRLPQVAIYNEQGKQIDATTDITKVDVTITFSEPIAGSLVLS